MFTIISLIITVLVIFNFLLMKYSSDNVEPNNDNSLKKVDQAEIIRREIKLNVERRLQEKPITYLKVV